jgi:hypothetical protein
MFCLKLSDTNIMKSEQKQARFDTEIYDLPDKSHVRLKILFLLVSSIVFEIKKSKKKSRHCRDFYDKEIFDYLLLSLIFAFLPVSSLK